MIFSVYGVDDALVTVSPFSTARVDGSTYGYRLANRAATASPIAAAVPTNAQPSRPARLANSPPARASTATTASPADTAVARCASVHTRNATATAPAPTPSRRASRLA